MLQVLNICSSDAYDGLDYMAATFHRWLQEPGRLIFITRMKSRVVRKRTITTKKDKSSWNVHAQPGFLFPSV